MIGEKRYVINWDQVKTLDDVKRIISVLELSFSLDFKGIDKILDLVIIEDDKPYGLIPNEAHNDQV